MTKSEIEGHVVPRSDGATRSVPSGRTADEADLNTALEQLSRLAVGDRSLESLLDRVANLTATAIVGADGAGVTMLETGRSATVCASQPFVGELDDVQYGLGQGPCVTALAEGRTVLSSSLRTDARWPQFGPRAGAVGVQSALSLPLIMPAGEVVGALNVYGRRRPRFIPTRRAAVRSSPWRLRWWSATPAS